MTLSTVINFISKRKIDYQFLTDITQWKYKNKLFLATITSVVVSSYSNFC